MRVMVVGPLGHDDFADNVQETLSRMGHEVLASGGARPKFGPPKLSTYVSVLSDHASVIDEYRQRRLVRTVERFRPDVVLSMDRRLHRTVNRAAKRRGARTALWFPDAVSNMGRHDMFLNGYDRIYLKNPVLVHNLQSVYGLPVRYLPEACNSSWHQSAERYGDVEAIVVAGNIHPTRAALIQRLLQAGLPIRIYGAPIPSWVRTPELLAVHTGRYIAGQEKADVFRRARVVLNNLHPGEYAGVNCRVFEACGSGGLVLTEVRPGLTDLFIPGRELDTFGSFEELTEKLRRYMKNPELGRSIADAGARRARADHTYERRLTALFEDLV